MTFMNNELQLLADWLRANKLSLNESKAKLLIFRSRRKLNIALLSIKLNNFILSSKKTFTYLSIEIDENLSWYKQLEILAKKLSGKNGILSKLRYVLKKTLTSICHSIFQSYVVYASTVWPFTSQNNMKKIFVFHKKCMRLLIFCNYHERTSPIFKSLKVLKLQDIINLLKLIYFFFNDQLLLQVKKIFINVCFIKNESVNPYNTRDGKLLFIPHINAAHSGTK